MKNSILIIGSILFATSTLLPSCQSSATKEKKAETNVMDARKDLAISQMDLYMVRLDTISNYEQFKIEANKVMVAQGKNISELKAKMVSEKNELNADYNEQLDVLETKNKELKTKLANYKQDGKDEWGEFKDEFNHDINEMGKAFKNLTVENVEE